MPPELTTMEKPKTAGFVDSTYRNANARRIAEEEAEMLNLMQPNRRAVSNKRSKQNQKVLQKSNRLMLRSLRQEKNAHTRNGMMTFASSKATLQQN